MGSINYGVLKARPAQRDRGLAFSERFKSEAEVVKNGGVIGGTGNLTISDGVLSGDNFRRYVRYENIQPIVGEINTLSFDAYIINNVSTMIAFDLSSTLQNFPYILVINSKLLLYFGSGNYLYSTNIPLNRWTNITIITDWDISLGNTKIYINGTLANGSSSTSGSPEIYNPMRVTGGSTDIGKIKVFNHALSPEEILTYYNNNMWSYMKESVIAAPMFLETNNKPSAGYTQDRSGNANHLQFSGATFSKGGYILDGVDDYFTNLPSATSRYPYMLIDTGSGLEMSTSSTDYNNMGISGAFAGTVYNIFLFESELNETQIADLHHYMISNFHMGQSGK